MSNARTIHVFPHSDGRWEVRVDGGPTPLTFADLGRALDAATSIATGGTPGRVVVHEQYAA